MKKIIVFFALLLFCTVYQTCLPAQQKSNGASSSIIVPTLIAAGVGIVGGYLAHHFFNADSKAIKQKQEIAVDDYVARRDKDDLIKLFNENSEYLGTTWSNFKALNNNRIVKIVGNSNDLIGFIMFRHQPELKTGLIDYMAIDKKYRRKKYGTQLINYALAALKASGAQKVMLSIKIHDQTAIDFYMKNGFRPDVNENEGKNSSSQQKYKWFTQAL